MQLETIRYAQDKGWTPGQLPAMDSENTLVMLFGASELYERDEPFRVLRDAYPQSCVVGCSTSGEIDGINVVDGSIIGAVARFEHSELQRAHARLTDSTESEAAAEAIAESLARDDLRAVLVLSDGINVNGSKLVTGFNRALPSSVVVTGGLAGDGDRFERTWTLQDGRPTTGLVSAVGLYGDRLYIGHGSRGGWDIFGPERKITRAKDNVLYELDGKPALALYKRYLGERAGELPAAALLFPLSVRASADAKTSVVRTILSIDEAAQSMTFAGDVPEGSLAQLMRANFDRLITAASDAADQARPDSVGDRDTLAIAISCVGRRLVLRSRTEEELEVALESLPERTTQVGFYSYGEISPFTTGRCDLHNQTMTLTTIREV